MHKERLLNVAKALRESTTPPSLFTMSLVKRECGTPACALGHYAARGDLQSEFKLGRMCSCVDVVNGCYSFGRVWDHFGIDHSEADELFGSEGCGDAKTAIAAAEYIERFVAEHGAT